MRNSKQVHSTLNSGQPLLNLNGKGAQDVSIPTEADRIALTNMFKAIAEYGRRIRLRRLTEATLPDPATLAKHGDESS